LQLGLLTVVADAVPVRRTGTEKKTSLSLVCKTHNTKPSQRYFCEECDIHYTPADLGKARETDEGLRQLTAEEIESVKDAGVPVGILNLQVCSAEELEIATRPSEQSYRLRLGKNSQSGAYALLRALVSDPSSALYGVCRLNARVAPTPFRVVVWRDQLVLQSLIRPADVGESEETPGEVDEALLGMGKELLAKLTKPFDADLLTDERVAKLAAIVAAEAPEIVPAKKVQSVDLLAQLAAALEVAA
jgi:non-homologous end joining protein Ku